MEGATVSTGQTPPPTKDYTWSSPGRWPHMWQKLALLDISGRRGPPAWGCSMPQCRGMSGQEDGTGWVGEHPHRGGGGVLQFLKETGKGENGGYVNQFSYVNLQRVNIFKGK